ncbi:MFS transporter [Microbacterium pseudoresistens]|uniref:MFS family permease n=1 Tax=Microbacterium pseudoresistens TaxID=640634 RepID=A0A7Y9JMI4_9MICO|nr:MFS transporter [Microbacterium pseudoresistens]NYD53573.1 MFS family permease [Microbacterium pseudoresistens]
MRITPHPWVMLVAAVVAQAATTVVAATPAFLIPLLHTVQGLSLAEAGLMAAAPNLGLVLTLVAWGAATDRWGERRIVLSGLAATTVAVLLAMLAQGFVAQGLALVLAGAMSACTNAASGRLIVGWFPPERRGLAMGIRQTCQPLGIALASLVVPALAAGGSAAPAFAFGGALCLVGLAFCALVVVDPAREPRHAAAPTRNPYRGSSVLQRIHAVSVLLVVPQFTLSTFGLIWFIVAFEWTPFVAGIVVAAAQVLGAVGRIVVGGLSDRIGSRLVPLRAVAIAVVVGMLATAAFGALDWAIPAAACYILASCLSVADNGLAFTAVAEIAGSGWAGRALGVQNTGQFLGAALVPPAIGAVIGLVGYPLAFALVAIAPAAAAILVPGRASDLTAGAPTGQGAMAGLGARSQAWSVVHRRRTHR